MAGGSGAVTIKLPSDTSIGGGSVAALTTVTSTSATAIAFGRNGATNPVLNVNCGTTSAATGVTIIGAAAASGVAVNAISSGTNESMTIDAKGTGTISLNATGTGKVILGRFANIKSITTPVAAAGTTVADAGQLGAGNIVHITSDGATKGVKAPTTVLGDFQYVINDSATACEFYAASGGTVNGLSADASVVIPASKGIFWQATGADTLIAFDLPAKATAS